MYTRNGHRKTRNGLFWELCFVGVIFVSKKDVKYPGRLLRIDHVLLVHKMDTSNVENRQAIPPAVGALLAIIFDFPW